MINLSHLHNSLHNFKEHYYDPITKRGFIEYRLWTIRKNISPSKKKYTLAKKMKMNTSKTCSESSDEEKEDLLPQELYEEKVRNEFLVTNSFP